VRQLKYAPEGKRGVALGIAHDLYRPAGAEFFARANQDTVVIIQVETAKAFENLEEIISVPGVDVAWIGHYDLTVSMGIPAQFDHLRLIASMNDLVRTCRKYGVAAGFLPPNQESAAHWIAEGFRMISLGSDIGIFLDGISRFRAHINQNGGER